MDLGDFGALSLDAGFFSALASIVLIDLILAGDNAVVIAMAVRSLPREHRRRGILLGSLAAVLLRVAATFFVAQLLRAPYVKLVGGLLIGWIAVKLFVEGSPEETRERAASGWPCASSWSPTSRWPSTTCSPSAAPPTATCSCCSSA